MKASNFPWELVLTVAMRQFGWPPYHVWQMTPREVLMATATSLSASKTPSRNELDALAARFPDMRSTHDR
ncbi:phage tail assembly chaperone [Cohaesibacter sp. ES.047]|uniref:phage tail assembly chaperone n=1 Tax=Cohaesibacter sp. ES.047 TaxID=1798205 RepID=UPI00352AA95A